MIKIENLKEWIHNWFPYFSEVVAKDQTSSNASKNLVTDTSGEVTLENKVSVSGGLSMSSSNQISHTDTITANSTASLKKIAYNGTGHITSVADVDADDIPYDSQNSVEDMITAYGTSIGNKADKTNGAYQITDTTSSFQHLGTLSDYKQSTINQAIDTKLGTLGRLSAYEITTDKGTATEDKMGKLYIETVNGVVTTYYVKATTSGSTTTYSWENFDESIFSGTIAWSNVTSKPSFGTTHSDFAYGDHTHDASAISYDNTDVDTFLDYLESSKEDAITSVLKVPASTDNTGTIIFYQGDEPT